MLDLQCSHLPGGLGFGFDSGLGKRLASALSARKTNFPIITSFLLVRNFFYQTGGKRERQGESESLSRSPSQEVRTYDAAQSKPQDAYTRLLLLGEQEAFRFHFPPFGVERTVLCRTGFGIAGSFHDLFSKGLEGARSAEAGR